MATVRVDLAIGRDGITAVLPPDGVICRVAARIDPLSDELGPALEEAIASLEERVRATLDSAETSASRVRVCVVLLPPLSEGRVVEMPPLRPEELERVARREAPRHFLGGNRPLLTGARRLSSDRRPGSGPSQVLLTAAARSLVEAVVERCEARGWEVERVSSAYGCWLDILLGEEFQDRRESVARDAEAAPSRALLAVLDDAVHLMLLQGDDALHPRRLPLSDLEDVAHALGPGSGSLLILAGAERRKELEHQLAGTDWSLLSLDGAATPEEAALQGAATAAPELVPDTLLRRRQERTRGVTRRLFAAAIILVLASAVVHYWGRVRAYEEVVDRRVALREQVAPALAARDSLDRIAARIGELQALQEDAAGWTSSLVELAVLLPPETHLVSFRAAGDTVVAEASGGLAGEALAALSLAPTLRDVRLEGQIQREIAEGASAGERFTISGILVPRGSTRVGRPRSGGGAAESGPNATAPESGSSAATPEPGSSVAPSDPGSRTAVPEGGLGVATPDRSSGAVTSQPEPSAATPERGSSAKISEPGSNAATPEPRTSAETPSAPTPEREGQ